MVDYRGRYHTGEDRTDLLSKIASLEKRISDLESNPRAQSTSVDVGSFIVKGGIFEVWQTDDIIFQVGPTIGLNNLPGFAYYYHDGTASFTQYGDNPDGSQFVAMWDASGNIVMSTDGVSGQGLATPWIALTGIRINDLSTPLDSTSSSSFVPFYVLQGYKQHPYISSIMIVTSDAGTTGEIRMFDLINSRVLETQSIPASDFSYYYFNVDIQGGHLTYMNIEFQIRRTGGAGVVRAGHVNSYGTQSP